MSEEGKDPAANEVELSEEAQAENKFRDDYTALLVRAWRDEELHQRLIDDPKAVAIEAGLPVAEGAEVQLDRSTPDDLYQLDTIVTDWNATPGRHVLHVSDEPLVDLSDLDERELESVVGGIKKGNNNNNNVVVVIV